MTSSAFPTGSWLAVVLADVFDVWLEDFSSAGEEVVDATAGASSSSTEPLDFIFSEQAATTLLCYEMNSPGRLKHKRISNGVKQEDTYKRPDIMNCFQRNVFSADDLEAPVQSLLQLP